MPRLFPDGPRWAAVLITILGVLGIFINRKNVIVILMSIELILLAVNINLVAFSTYLDDITGLWSARPGDLAQTVAEGLFPSWEVDAATVSRFETAIADDSLPSSLRRILAEHTADLTRALAARKVDTAAGD